MKIYLAGKMDAEHGAWRDGLLGSVYDYERHRPLPRWEIVRKISDDYDYDDLELAGLRWPQTENRHVLGLHEYVGPYRWTFAPEPESKHSGYFHGSTARGQHGMMDDGQATLITRECLAAINRADFVFAYINNPDCFGTLAEIGYASALRKYIHLVTTEESWWGCDDYWFIGEMVSQTVHDTQYNRTEGESEQERVRRFFEGALVSWTGMTRVETPRSLVPTSSRESRLASELAQSFSQIARWSADPRVRDEAQRMLRRITG